MGIIQRVPIGVGNRYPQRTRKQLMERLESVKPTNSQEQFQEDANRVAIQFALNVTGGILTEEERTTIRDFGYQETGNQL